MPIPWKAFATAGLESMVGRDIRSTNSDFTRALFLADTPKEVDEILNDPQFRRVSPEVMEKAYEIRDELKQAKLAYQQGQDELYARELETETSFLSDVAGKRAKGYEVEYDVLPSGRPGPAPRISSIRPGQEMQDERARKVAADKAALRKAQNDAYFSRFKFRPKGVYEAPPPQVPGDPRTSPESPSGVPPAVPGVGGGLPGEMTFTRTPGASGVVRMGALERRKVKDLKTISDASDKAREWVKNPTIQEHMGPVVGRATNAAIWLGGGLGFPPEVIKFNSFIRNLADAWLRERTGAQANESEVQTAFGHIMPHLGLTPEAAIARIEAVQLFNTIKINRYEGSPVEAGSTEHQRRVDEAISELKIHMEGQGWEDL